MSGRRSVRRQVAALALAGLLTGPFAACGGADDTAPTAAEQVPSLATQLARIDTALVAERYPRARRLLDRLSRTAIEARTEGRLDGVAADRVLAAATRLLAALPAPAPPEGPSDSPPPAPADDGRDPTGGDGKDGKGDPDGGSDKPDKPDKPGRPDEPGGPGNQAKDPADEAREKRQQERRPKPRRRTPEQPQDKQQGRSQDEPRD